VSRVSAKIEHGEFFTFLGPSGCGKTTTLRIIAGLELPDSGRVFIDGEDVTYLPPYRRDTAMVFQNYALWPHMTVFDNVAYGLKVRKLPREEIRRRVREVLELVRLEGLEDRYPTQLSGGQQQRVALARALVVQPKVLLLDEPLSNLDAKLRVEMREELKRLQRKLGITTIYVTHDQDEAMALSDRIAVMNLGRVVEVGKPDELYRRPRSFFVATFIGRSNVVECRTTEVRGEEAVLECTGVKLVATVADNSTRLSPGDRVYAVFRPHSARLDPLPQKTNELSGSVLLVSYAGEHVEVRLESPIGRLLVYLPPDSRVSVGDRVRFYLSWDDVLAYPVAGEYVI
jgi:spermidine/putrescine ABC transporter ATP-binding subunit